jgi:hypothetical protein
LTEMDECCLISRLISPTFSALSDTEVAECCSPKVVLVYVTTANKYI